MEKYLYESATAGDLDAVKLCLKTIADVDGPSACGRTALWMAASRGHAAVCGHLLRAGARPGWRDGGGRLPIEAAATRGHAARASPRRATSWPPRTQATKGDTPRGPPRRLPARHAAQSRAAHSGNPRSAARPPAVHSSASPAQVRALFERDFVVELLHREDQADEWRSRGVHEFHEAAFLLTRRQGSE